MQEWGIDDADEGLRLVDEADGDAEHGEEVDVIDGSVERVDAPCWAVVDQVVSRGALRVRFLAYESEAVLGTASGVWVEVTHLCEGYFSVIFFLMKASTSVRPQ